MAITKKPCIHAALIILLFSLFVSASSQTTGPGPKKPNVVFILVDNTGWGDFSVYGGTTATPLIDKLASEGIRFNNCTSYPLFNDMVKEVLARQRVPELLDQPPQILEDGRESPPGQLALDIRCGLSWMANTSFRRRSNSSSVRRRPRNPSSSTSATRRCTPRVCAIPSS